MRKLRRLPKPRIRNNVVKQTDNLIVEDFELEYQEFIKDLKDKREKDEKATQEENIQDIQSDRQ